jgi:hypothetical protein
MWVLPMINLKIRHKTTYHYCQPVNLWPHRLMLRPRESRDLRLISSKVAVTPAAVVTWATDVSGNAVATANFQTTTQKLVIDSAAELTLNTSAWPVFDIAASAIFYPFRYSDDEWADLGALILCSTTRSFRRQSRANTSTPDARKTANEHLPPNSDAYASNDE